MFLGIANAISGLKSGGLSYIKDNLKLYLDFKSSRSDTLAFPSEGSTYFITDDYIAVPDNDAFDFNESDVSITVWIKPTDLDTNYIILDKRVADEKGFYLMAHGSQNSPFFQISDGTNDYYAYSDDDLVAGAWNHIAVSFKVAGTGDATFYLNGVDAGIAYPQTANVGDTSNTAEVRIGKASDGYTASPFKGSIANLAVWSRALSQEEVQSVMNKSYSQLGSVEKTSLVMWQSLDSASNGVVTPASGEALGSELMTDGNFDSGISDFDNNSTGWVYRDNALGVVDGSATTAIYARNNSDSGTITAGGLYKVQFTVVEESGGNLRMRIGAGSYTYIYDSGTYTKYIIAGSSTTEILNIYAEGNWQGYIDNVSVKKVTSNTGVVTGATTTTSVYGGNAPILPRAIDIAESFADKIGNGSALFNGSSDIIDIGSNSILDNVFVGGATLTAWIKPSSDGENNLGRIFDKSTATSGANGWHLLVQGESSSKVELRFGHVFSGSQPFWDSTLDVILNEWNHVAVTYDNGSTSNNPKFYINGINVAVTEGTVPSGSAGDDSSQNLFIGNNTGLDRTFDGSIASAGIWQGLLSQEKIQSVMESTSYAKIPASVKSNLGSNTFVSLDNFETKSGGQVSVANNEVTLTIPTGGDSGMQIGNLAGFGISSSLGYADNDLAKISFEAKVVTNASGFGNTVRFKDNQGNVITNTDITLTTEYQTFTNYYVLTTVSGYRIPMLYRNGSRTGEDVQKFRNFSVQKVTNDLVAYYPLDADSSNTSSLGITNDSVGGETLGINLIDNHNKDRWIAESGNSDDNITNGVQLIFGGGASGNYAMINDALLSISGLASDTLYKTTFTASYSGGSSAPSIRLNDGTTSYDNVLTTTPTEYEVYFQKNGSAYLQIVNQVTSNVTDVINWTIKEVTSNTGVLK